MQKILIFTLLSVQLFSFAQNRSPVDISIGTNILSTFSGNLNINSEVTLFKIFSIDAGMGMMPFGYFYDFANRNEFDQIGSVTRIDIERGRNISIGMKRLFTNGKSDWFMGYFEIRMRKWHYELNINNPYSLNPADNFTKGNRFKLSLGYGLQKFVNSNLGIDACFGLSFIQDEFMTRNMGEFSLFESSGSLNLSLNIFYKL